MGSVSITNMGSILGVNRSFPYRTTLLYNSVTEFLERIVGTFEVSCSLGMYDAGLLCTMPGKEN